MKISSINNFNNIKYSNTKNNLPYLKNNQIVSYKNYAKMPSTNQYLAINPAFTGGYSLSLLETVKNLNDASYPPDIKALAQEVLDNGNPENKTLINVHKAKYGKINQMKSLDEVKAAYPEFNDVLSDENVQYNANSFIDDVRNGKLEWFDEDTDLALQLLQMYWADGFSINDLKEYTNGKDIDGTFKKLNIPKLNSTYANVLKLSDKKYNERFTSEMYKRLKGIERKKAEKRDGVYIPRGPMPDEQKKKISEGLIKHYAEHPEKLIEMSERMKQYYKEHPEERENLSDVLEISWNLREARSVRKALSKFLSKKDITPDEFAKLNLTENKMEGNTLKDFWNRMPWAKKQWSACMTKGWEIHRKQKEKEEDKKNLISIAMYPPSMERNMISWFKSNGYNLDKIDDLKAYVRLDGREMPSRDKYTSKAVSAYLNEFDKNGEIQASMLHLCLLRSFGDIYYSKTLSDATRIATCEYLMDELQMEPDKADVNEMTISDVTNIYARIYSMASEDGVKEIIDILENNLEKSYLAVQKRNVIPARKAKNKADNVANVLQNLIRLRKEGFLAPECDKAGDYIIIPKTMQLEIAEMMNNITDAETLDKMVLEYVSAADNYNMIKDACQLSVLSTLSELLKEARKDDCPQEEKDVIYAIKNYVFSKYIDEAGNFINIQMRDLASYFTNIVNVAKQTGCADIAQKFWDNFDSVYCEIKDSNTSNIVFERIINNFLSQYTSESL